MVNNQISQITRPVSGFAVLLQNMEEVEEEEEERAGAGFNVHNTTGPIILAGANMQFNDVFSQRRSMLMFFSAVNNKTSETPAPPTTNHHVCCRDLDYQEADKNDCSLHVLQCELSDLYDPTIFYTAEASLIQCSVIFRNSN